LQSVQRAHLRFAFSLTGSSGFNWRVGAFRLGQVLELRFAPDARGIRAAVMLPTHDLRLSLQLVDRDESAHQIAHLLAIAATGMEAPAAEHFEPKAA